MQGQGHHGGVLDVAPRTRVPARSMISPPLTGGGAKELDLAERVRRR